MHAILLQFLIWYCRVWKQFSGRLSKLDELFQLHLADITVLRLSLKVVGIFIFYELRDTRTFYDMWFAKSMGTVSIRVQPLIVSNLAGQGRISPTALIHLWRD